MTKKGSRGARLAGELPISFKALSTSSSSGRAHISSRGKCSNSRSLYYAADGYEFEASSRQDLRRSASALYLTVDCEFDEPSSSRSSRRREVRSSKNETTTSLNAGASSFRAPRETTISLRADDSGVVIGRRNIISGCSFGSHCELPATGGQQETCVRRKKKIQEDGKNGRGEGGGDHIDARVRRRRQRSQLLQSEDSAATNCAWQNVHKNLSQSCRMEIGQVRSRTASARHGSSEAVADRKLRSLSSIAMGYEVGILHSDEKTIAPTALRSPDLQGGGQRSAQRKENCCKKRVYHNLQRKSDARHDVQAAKKLEKVAMALSSGELDMTAFVGEKDFARSSWRSQLGASFTMEGSSRSHGVEYYTSPSPDHSSTSVATAAVPFNWEEAPGKPKTIAAAMEQRPEARSLSKEGMQLSSLMQELFESAAVGATSMELRNGSNSSRRSEREPEIPVLLKSRRNSDDQRAVGERSHRYYNQFATQTTEKSLEPSGSRSSGWLISQEKEIHIDLVAPAAAKFLVQETSYLSPVATPPHYAFASPGAVPFKWEETPGKPRVDNAAFAPQTLQLPPRLAIPQQRADIRSSFSGRDLRAHYLTNHSSYSGAGALSGFFTPGCLMSACSSPRQQNAAAVFQPLPHSVFSSKGSKSLPRKLSNSTTQLGSCRNSSHSYSSVLPTCEDHPHESVKNSKISNRSAFSAPLVTSSPAPGLQPRRLYSSELKASHPWIDKVKTGRAPRGGGATTTTTTHATTAAMINSSSLTRSNELHALDSTEILSEITPDSASNPSSLSGYLDALAQTASTPMSATSASDHVRSCKSSSRSHASYESLEQELGHMEPPATTSPRCSQFLRPHHASGVEAVDHHTKHIDFDVCPSLADTAAAAAAALEMQQLSPSGVNLDIQQQECNAASSSFSSSMGRSKASSSSTSSTRWTGPKIRHRVRFIFTMCKALKRMLFRQRQHRKVVVESKLQYPDGISLPGFPFVKAD